MVQIVTARVANSHSRRGHRYGAQGLAFQRLSVQRVIMPQVVMAQVVIAFQRFGAAAFGMFGAQCLWFTDRVVMAQAVMA